MMAPPSNSPAHLSEQPEGAIEQYRPVSGLAVAAVVLGVVSLAAWAEPFLAVVGVVGVLVSLAAMWQIVRNAPEMIGRKAVLAGLFLSVFALVGTASQWYTHRMLVRKEASQFAQQWFDFVLSKQTHNAFEMTGEQSAGPEPVMVGDSLQMPPGGPQTPPDQLYARRPDIRALVAVAERARSRYYQTEIQRQNATGDEIQQVYAVTYDKDGVKTSFFVRLRMERSVDEKTAKAHWQIKSSDAGIKPVALGGKLDA